MINAIEYRPAVPSDIPRLQEIFNAQYARKKGEGYFKWQYFDSAWPTVLICAEENGLVEGMFGLQRREIDGAIPVGQAIDLLISPRLRGRGIFAEMGRQAVACFPEIRLLCVLPNLNGRNACVKSLGWRDIGKIDELVISTNALPTGCVTLPERVQTKCHPAACFNWTDDLLTWRFERHPDYKYETVTVNSGASAITKVFQDPVTGRRFGDIVNFRAPLDDTAVLSDTFITASRHLAVKGVESITTWALPHTLLNKVLTQIGFSAKSQERYFCVKSLDSSLDYLEDISSWHLLQADAEIY